MLCHFWDTTISNQADFVADTRSCHVRLGHTDRATVGAHKPVVTTAGHYGLDIMQKILPLSNTAGCLVLSSCLQMTKKKQ